MKKILLTMILILTTLSLACLPCTAIETSDKAQEFYVSAEEAKVFIELFQKDSFDYKKLLANRNYTVLEEAITPVYVVDPLKYAETGVLEIERWENT